MTFVGTRPKWKEGRSWEIKNAEMEVTARERIACVHARKHAQGKRQLEKEKHARMGGRPNIGRVRVLVMLCKWLKSPKCKNIDTQVSYRGCWLIEFYILGWCFYNNFIVL